jgi:hypothetical protein
MAYGAHVGEIMAKKKYTLPAPEAVQTATAFRAITLHYSRRDGAFVHGEWIDGSENTLKTEDIPLTESECDDLLGGFTPASETLEERMLSWLSANGKLTGGGTVEDETS